MHVSVPHGHHPPLVANNKIQQLFTNQWNKIYRANIDKCDSAKWIRVGYKSVSCFAAAHKGCALSRTRTCNEEVHFHSRYKVHVTQTAEISHPRMTIVPCLGPSG